MLRSLPALPEQSRFSVPLHTLLDDGNVVVDRTIGTFIAEHRVRSGPVRHARADHLPQHLQRLRRAAGSGADQTSGDRRQFAAPRSRADRNLSRRDAAHFVFDGPVPFGLTQHKSHHWAIYGRTGHGKTQLLQTLILEHLQEPEPQALIVIDSQGREGMLKKIEQLDIFARDPDRLLVIDAEADPSPALNMFDVPKLDEAAEIEIIDLYTYIFSAIDADLTVAPVDRVLLHRAPHAGASRRHHLDLARVDGGKGQGAASRASSGRRSRRSIRSRRVISPIASLRRRPTRPRSSWRSGSTASCASRRSAACSPRRTTSSICSRRCRTRRSSSSTPPGLARPRRCSAAT